MGCPTATAPPLTLNLASGRSSSRRTHSIPLSPPSASIRHLDRHDLRGERPLALRAEGLLIGAESETVLLGAAETALLRDELAAETHVPVSVRVHETVDHVCVLEVVLAERQARTKPARE